MQKIEEKNKENAKLKAEVGKLHSSQEYYLSTIQELTEYTKIVEEQLTLQVIPHGTQQTSNSKADVKQQEYEIKRLEILVRNLEEEKQNLQEQVCNIVTKHS